MKNGFVTLLLLIFSKKRHVWQYRRSTDKVKDCFLGEFECREDQSHRKFHQKQISRLLWGNHSRDVADCVNRFFHSHLHLSGQALQTATLGFSWSRKVHLFSHQLYQKCRLRYYRYWRFCNITWEWPWKGGLKLCLESNLQMDGSVQSEHTSQKLCLCCWQ